jgi:micrococcal nuclease
LDSNNVQHKIRLHGIDCPELNQPFGKAAKQFVSDLIFGNYVNVETNKKDRYGRTIGIVTLANNTILNEVILKNGYAWHYLEYLPVRICHPQQPMRFCKPHLVNISICNA